MMNIGIGKTHWECNYVTDSQALKIAENMEKATKLLSIEIYGDFRRENRLSLTSFGGSAIIEAVGKHRNIRSLTLDGNTHMNDEIALSISEMLKTNRSLQFLSMRDCGLTNTTAGFIAEGLELNKTLKTLRIDTNSIDDVGRGFLKNAVKTRGVPLNIS